MAGFSFSVTASDGQARTGLITTPHGTVRTPAFMPVGTAGSVKAVYPDQLRSAGTDIVLGNTYHLMLRPGPQIVHSCGGLRKFMNWNGPILTDSGGYQVFSLRSLTERDDNGVTFRSHIDGSLHRLTSERSIAIQADLLGADIVMQFDECTEFPCTHRDAKTSMELSLRWAERSRKAFGNRTDQAIFGIVQGSVFEDLRSASARQLVELGFDGYAIGGLSVGEGHSQMSAVVKKTTPLLPRNLPRYLMGAGKPADIVAAVAHGTDMFDCVIPTRSGRHGQAWTQKGPINLTNSRFASDMSPLDTELSCPASRLYSRAYLHHLFKAREPLGPAILSWHNIAFFQSLMAEIRSSINNGCFGSIAQRYAISERPLKKHLP